MEEKDRRTRFVEDCCKKASEQASYGIMRNMGIFLEDLRKLADEGEDARLTMRISIQITRGGTGRATVKVAGVSWSRTAKYTDSDFDEVEVDIDQPELPFREEGAQEPPEEAAPEEAAAPSGDGCRFRRSWANLRDAAREIGRKEGREVYIYRQCWNPSVPNTAQTIERLAPNASGWDRGFLADEDAVVDAIAKAFAAGHVVLCRDRLARSSAKMLGAADCEVKEPAARASEAEERFLLDGGILNGGYTLDVTD